MDTESQWELSLLVVAFMLWIKELVFTPSLGGNLSKVFSWPVLATPFRPHPSKLVSTSVSQKKKNEHCDIMSFTEHDVVTGLIKVNGFVLAYRWVNKPVWCVGWQVMSKVCSCLYAMPVKWSLPLKVFLDMSWQHVLMKPTRLPTVYWRCSKTNLQLTSMLKYSLTYFLCTIIAVFFFNFPDFACTLCHCACLCLDKSSLFPTLPALIVLNKTKREHKLL